MRRRSGPLEAAQHALPLVLLTLGVLELGGIIVSLVQADPTGIAAAGGPSAFIPVTLAVVFSTLLRASARSLLVKGATAVGALVFALVRVGLVAGIALTDPEAVPLGSVLGVVSGIVLGLALAAWAAMEFLAARIDVRQAGTDVPQQPTNTSPASPAPPTSPSPAVADDPATTRTHLSGRIPRPVEPSPRPEAPLPMSGVTPPAGPGKRVHAASGAIAWHRGSTPWPRKNEDDPDGTLLRPPRRR